MRPLLRIVPVALVVACVASLLAPRGGETVPLYAARTGLMCQNCHFDPNGGGPRKEFGFAYAKNRHEIEPEDSSSKWSSLELVNRVGDAMPLYFGINQRVLLLANSTRSSDSLDRVGFFDMENALHIAFQPHDQLTLVYTRTGSASRDAYGMFAGLPWDGYLKAGRVRTAFGLRMDDHTVATRNSFLDFQTQQTFLPYDPRLTDVGLEYGMASGPWFGRAQWLNGESFVFNGEYAGATVAKLGYSAPWYQGAVSVYDDFRKQTFGPTRRATRWGYYGMTHWQRFALLGEVAAGTDEAVTGEKRNSLAYFAELDYVPSRWATFRVRYDRLMLDRGASDAVSLLNDYNRYAIEGEFQPVPFGQVRWTFRLIDPRAEDDGFGTEIPNEKQAYVQFHFSY
ncbi:MAG: hypothetical protein HOP12_01480 [Candidatus Eisenbacteria bacterium]|uniref:Porin n=1 Tax=Eiseniibacteriota bacterium TaxID=2212470 RepID=A0A849SUD6_UNCEI|nr:hypothetical protein [Candidatus Eisenbacteria bacterium]